jgi:hypothetical protein
MFTGFWWRNLRERNHLEVPGIDWEDNFKMDHQEVGWVSWTGLIWLRTGTGGRNL